MHTCRHRGGLIWVKAVQPLSHYDYCMKRLFHLVCLVASVVLGPFPTFAQTLPDGDLVGTSVVHTAVKGDTVASIARRYDVGTVELLAANPGIKERRLDAGVALTIPGRHVLPAGARNGIVINLSELRLFYFMPDGRIMTFPVSIGKAGWDTPVGSTFVKGKRKNPVWIPPPSIRAHAPGLPQVVPAGPNNPLGRHALYLGWDRYLIHGTNDPTSIGKSVSHGCIRMYPEDVATLFEQVPVGTPVTFVDEPMKFGRSGDTLYLEVTPTQTQGRRIAAFRAPEPVPEDDKSLSELGILLLVLQMVGAEIDYDAAGRTVREHTGVPTAIGR